MTRKSRRQEKREQKRVEAGLIACASSNPFDRFLGVAALERLGRGDLVIVFAAFPVLLAVYFLPLMTDGKVLGADLGDITSYWYSARAYLGDALRHLRIPLWNPHIMAGTPYLATNQTGVFFPCNWLFAFFSTTFVLNFQTLFHFWLGLATMHLLLRRIGMGLPAACAGAMLFGFSGFAVLHWLAGHIVFLSEWPFTPIAVLAWVEMQRRAADRRTWRAHLASFLALSAAICLQFFSGHPQIVYFTLLIVAGLHLGWAASALFRGSRLVLLTGTGWLAAGLLMAGLLASVQALPTLLHARETVRASGIALTYYEDQSQPISNIITLFSPWAWGGPRGIADQFYAENFWELNAYLGACGCLLLAAGIALPRRNSALQWTCLVLVIAGSWLALGRYGWLYKRVFHIVPGMSLFRNPGRFLYLVTFAGSILAAGGFQRLIFFAECRHRDFKRMLFVLLSAVAAGALLFIVLYREGSVSQLFVQQVLPRTPPPLKGKMDGPIIAQVFAVYHNRTLVAFLVALLGAGGLFALWWDRKRVAAWGFCGLMAIELLAYAWPFRMSFDASNLDQWVAPFRERIAAAGSLFRIGSVDTNMRLDFNDVMNVGVRHVWGYEPTATDRYSRVFMASQSIHVEGMAPTFVYTKQPNPLLNALGMRYVIFGASAGAPPDPSWRVVQRTKNHTMYENPRVMPRAFTVGGYKVTTPSETIAVATSPDFNPAESVLLEEQPPDSQASTAWVPGRIEVQVDEPEHFMAKVVMAAPGWFVLMDQCLPGWIAKVDGRPVRVFRANAVGRAIALDAGEHIVSMDYSAPGYGVGRGLSTVGWLAWSLLLAAIFKLKPRPKEHNSSQVLP